jgi:hypothetical protein
MTAAQSVDAGPTTPCASTTHTDAEAPGSCVVDLSARIYPAMPSGRPNQSGDHASSTIDHNRGVIPDLIDDFIDAVDWDALNVWLQPLATVVTGLFALTAAIVAYRAVTRQIRANAESVQAQIDANARAVQDQIDATAAQQQKNREAEWARLRRQEGWRPRLAQWWWLRRWRPRWGLCCPVPTSRPVRARIR